MTNRIAFILFASLLAACGGGGGVGDESGVDQGKPITDLDASEVSQFCTWSNATQGGAGTVHECGDGVTFEVPTQAECESDYAQIPDGCSGVTVAEMEACVSAIADDPCGAFEAEACAEYFTCIFG
jgi:hypothetical protein